MFKTDRDFRLMYGRYPLPHGLFGTRALHLLYLSVFSRFCTAELQSGITLAILTLQPLFCHLLLSGGYGVLKISDKTKSDKHYLSYRRKP